MSGFPKILWQSYISISHLPGRALPCIDSWLRLNPEWNYHFCSDEDVLAFFRSYRSGRYLELFYSLPLPVMKADLWRYAVLEEFGGFYADIDTRCLASLDDWLDRSVGLHVACEQEKTYFCQWALGGAAHHPVFRSVLELIRSRVESDGGVDETKDHYVHHYTGPSVWSDALRKVLKVEGTPGAIRDNRSRQEENNVCLYAPGYFSEVKIRHETASVCWVDVPSYTSWQAQRKDLANRLF